MNGDVKTKIIKRNGEEVTFDLDKIINAITKANEEVTKIHRTNSCWWKWKYPADYRRFGRSLWVAWFFPLLFFTLWLPAFQDLLSGVTYFQRNLWWRDHKKVVENFLPSLFQSTVQAFLFTGWTEGRKYLDQSTGRLAYAEWCFVGDVAEGSGDIIR